MHKLVIDDNGNSFVHSTLDDGVGPPVGTK